MAMAAFSARVTTAIALVVVAVWIGSVVTDALLRDYDVPLSVHAAMMGVVGAAFGTAALRRNGSDDDDDRKKPTSSRRKP